MTSRGRIALGIGWALLGLLAIVGAVVVGGDGILDALVIVCGGSAFYSGCGIASSARDE